MASFLGLCTYYSAFIPNYSHLAAKLQNLKKDSVISWTPELTQCFNELIDKFRGDLVRVAPRWDDLQNNPFILTTDYSGQAMGYVLSQCQDGQDRLIAAGGKKCNPAEQAYGSSKGEMAALVYRVTKFDNYLSLTDFIIRTDNQALTYLTKMKHTSNIWTRWLQLLQPYSFTIQHVPGKYNRVADAISREPRLFAEEPLTADQEVFNQVLAQMGEAVHVLSPGDGLKELVEDDPDLLQAFDNLKMLQDQDPPGLMPMGTYLECDLGGSVPVS